MIAETKPRPEGGALLVRIMAAAAALAVVAGILVDTVLLTLATDVGNSRTNAILQSPLVFLYYAGPTLVVLFMASRSRSMLAAALPFFLAVTIAALFVVYAPPWHFRRWHNPDFAWVSLCHLVFVCPGVVVSWAFWMALNRRS